MKTLYIFLTRSGTLLSNLVYRLTGAQYTHISLAFDEDLSTLYSSTRKNGYTMFPAGPSREYLNRGVFLMRENIPCALYALEVTDEAYIRAKRRTQHPYAPQRLRRAASAALPLPGHTGRPAPAPEHGDGRGGERHGPLPERPSGGCQGRRAASVLIFEEIAEKIENTC